MAVDYNGICQAVGVLSGYSYQGECVSVTCSSLSATGYKPVIPPGENSDINIWLTFELCTENIAWDHLGKWYNFWFLHT